MVSQLKAKKKLFGHRIQQTRFRNKKKCNSIL